MDNQNQPKSQGLANIARQQPIISVEKAPSSNQSNQKPRDNRIWYTQATNSTNSASSSQQSPIKSRVNLVQQPINSVTTDNPSSIHQPSRVHQTSLDQRIRDLQTTAAQTKKVI